MSEQTVEDLQRELRGVQEMLAFVLYEVGEPVVVPKFDMVKGLPQGAQIRIDENKDEETFVFYLEADA